MQGQSLWDDSMTSLPDDFACSCVKEAVPAHTKRLHHVVTSNFFLWKHHTRNHSLPVDSTASEHNLSYLCTMALASYENKSWEVPCKGCPLWLWPVKKINLGRCHAKDCILMLEPPPIPCPVGTSFCREEMTVDWRVGFIMCSLKPLIQIYDWLPIFNSSLVGSSFNKRNGKRQMIVLIIVIGNN